MSMVTREEMFADAVWKSLQEMKVSLEQFKQETPKGLWGLTIKNLSSNYTWPTTNQNMSAYNLNHKNKIIELLRIKSSGLFMDIESPKPDIPKTRPASSETLTRGVVIQIVNEILDNRIQDLKSALPVSASTLKQLPEGDTGSPVPFATCTRPRLKELFLDECKRLKLSQAGLLNAILYTYFNEPSLK